MSSSSSLACLVLSFLIYLSQVLRTATLTQQMYTVYEEPNCKGQSETFKSSVRHLNHYATSKLGYYGHIRSRRIYAGVWREFPEPNFLYDARSQASVIDGNDGSICITSSRPNQTYQNYKSVRQVGNSNLSQAGLSLFGSPKFSGYELYFEGSRLSLPTAQGFGSWGYTGRSSWTVYDQPDFTGRSMCLGPPKAIFDLWAWPRVVYDMNAFLVIGSLHRGCYRNLGLAGPPHSINVIDTSDTDRLAGLTLYTFQTHLFSNGDQVRLPRPRSFSSYSFSGSTPRNWSLYETLEDFERSASAICVHHDGINRTRPEQIQTRFEEAVGIKFLKVVGVRMGCPGDPDVETRPVKYMQNSGNPSIIAVFSIAGLPSFQLILGTGLINLTLYP